MKKNLFRKSALDKMASLDNLDQAMTVIKPANILTITAVAVVLAAAVVWCFTGSIPDTVTGSGVLTNADRITVVKYANQGALKNIFVKQGDYVSNGQVIARVERQDLLDQIKVNTRKLEGLQKMKDLLKNTNKSSMSKHAQMKELYDQGLITESEFINSRQTEINYDQQINEVRQQLAVYNDNYETATQVVSSASGTVIEVPVRKGDYITAGGTIVIISSDKENIALEARVYFPATVGQKIKPGMKIGLIPSSVKQEEYGYIEGIVTGVSSYPVSPAYLSSSLQNVSLAESFHKIGNPIEVKVSIIPDPNTVSGYKWSSSKGPDQKISAGYVCSGIVTTSSQHPIELIIPALKKHLLGIGDDTENDDRRKQ